MNQLQVLARRLHAQGLVGGGFDSIEVAVRRLGAVQSQEYGLAKWSIGERVPGSDDTAVEGVYNDGRLLRTHTLRPTWHFVPPEDIRWLLGLTSPRVNARFASAYRSRGLDEETFAVSLRVIARVLQDGPKARRPIESALNESGIATDNNRLSHILMQAELSGLICSGGLEGKQHTYALLEERVPAAPALSADEALAELTLRYFSGHGPATVKDFGWWSSLTQAEIKRGLEMSGSRLASEAVNGRTYWFAPSGPPPIEPSPTVHLLQAYDEYIVAFSESRDLLDPTGTMKLLPLGTDVFTHAVVLDGRVCGRWRRTLTRNALVIQATLARPFSAQESAALHRAAEQYRLFLGARSVDVRSYESSLPHTAVTGDHAGAPAPGAGMAPTG